MIFKAPELDGPKDVPISEMSDIKAPQASHV